MKYMQSIVLIAMYLISTTILAHKIGENYQGGIIFWVDEKGEHGLIAAPKNLRDPQNNIMSFYGTWEYEDRVIDATQEGFLAGKYNTNRIIESYGVPQPYTYSGVYESATYMGGGYGDWYLPSKYELNLMYKQKDTIGGFEYTSMLFSSSVSKNNIKLVWGQQFCSACNTSGLQAEISKRATFNFRCIRAF